jgi:uncharacterized iron-regulated membrane protein
MRYKEIRQFNFPLHRYLGLAVGIILAIVGLTGSALVFQSELDHAAVRLQYGRIVPEAHRLSPEVVLNKVKTIDANKESITIASIDLATASDLPDKVKIKLNNNESVEIFVNPYTGNILGDRPDSNLFKWIRQLHDHLLLGRIGNLEIGKIIVGIVAFLFLVINLTGVILWDGWRKLPQGFTIQWQAKSLRVNYDIHKVVGILAVTFLTFTAFTGFLWNFKLDKPVARLITQSSTPLQPTTLESKPTKDCSILSLTAILQIADAALPNAVTTKIKFPETPNEVFKVHKKFPQEHGQTGRSRVAIDPYSGEILELKNGLNLPLYQQVLNSFEEIHYGTFAGLPTRILYVLVGVTPLILLITGLVMYIHRRPKVKKVDKRPNLSSLAQTAKKLTILKFKPSIDEF